jgi:hypothetical protein
MFHFSLFAKRISIHHKKELTTFCLMTNNNAQTIPKRVSKKRIRKDMLP